MGLGDKSTGAACGAQHLKPNTEHILKPHETPNTKHQRPIPGRGPARADHRRGAPAPGRAGDRLPRADPLRPRPHRGGGAAGRCLSHRHGRGGAAAGGRRQVLLIPFVVVCLTLAIRN
ncbi:MAG: hypothetical protein MZV70_06425 [Desulfobacterales bacterium]|nr:hypothetical protein [Desulfobacterales bacterium]